MVKFPKKKGLSKNLIDIRPKQKPKAKQRNARKKSRKPY